MGELWAGRQAWEASSIPLIPPGRKEEKEEGREEEKKRGREGGTVSKQSPLTTNSIPCFLYQGPFTLTAVEVAKTEATFPPLVDLASWENGFPHCLSFLHLNLADDLDLGRFSGMNRPQKLSTLAGERVQEGRGFAPRHVSPPPQCSPETVLVTFRIGRCSERSP